ncbi:MAG TPA: peptidylprolyl isomerase [Planctomycetota bacterium]|nr:peptidylprolyl isomerase [Planctomycetota bacterium]
MAQHKAPTAVTVAPLQERSGFGLWMSKHWLHAAIVVLAIGAYLVVRYQREQGQHHAVDTSWEKLVGQLERDPKTGDFKGEPTALAALATDLKDTAAGPSARVAEAKARLDRRDFDGAQAALDALVREHPGHPWVVAKFKVGEASMTLVESIRASIANAKAFNETYPGMRENPAPPADAPRVRLVTDQGAIVVALYPGKAPKHCENFLKLCREGFYAGTKLHKVVPKFIIQGGDPNSKAGDPASWGQGGPGYKLDPEPNDLFHFAGSLAMAKAGGDPQEFGSQFYITTDPAHGQDGTNTIFGVVIEGMDVVQKIAAAPNTPSSDRPVTPVVLTSTEVL